MHSAHRDLESKFKRVLTDLALAQKNLQQTSDKLNDRNNEVTQLKTRQSDNEATMAQDKEDIGAAKREINIKAR